MDVDTTTDLDRPNYDPVAHLNTMFSTSGSLSQLEDVRSHLALYQTHLEYQQSEPVEMTADEQESLNRVDESPRELENILNEVSELKTQAGASEKSITDMTMDIKRLDNTKSNLVKSITVLRRLQMLTNAYDQLVAIVNQRQYKEMAQTLPAVLELMAHFKSFRSIQQIAMLSKQIGAIQKTISDQIFKDFETAIDGKSRGVSGLADACKVLDSLSGGNYRDQLIQWYCNHQLKDHRSIFKTNDEAGSLENIDRRYGHFQRLLKRHQDEFAQYFSSDWPVAEELCKNFINSTREDVQILLKQAGRGVDVQLLLQALEATLKFESKFIAHAFPERASSFNKISTAFQPHLNVWIEHQDKVLSNKFAQFRAPPAPGTAEDEEEPKVLPTSADLFAFYKSTLGTTAKLSTGPPLLDLANLFGKWLLIYCNQILKPIIPTKVATEDDIKCVCLALNTADYCRTTTDQLEQRILKDLDEDQHGHMSLEPQKDAFTEIINTSISQLTIKVDGACDYAWREMINTNWTKLEEVGDQSSYISELKRLVQNETESIVTHFHKDLYARLFLDKVVDVVSMTFLSKLAAIKPITVMLAGQLQLDIYVLKSCFLDLPKLRGPDFNISKNFTKHVEQSVHRVEVVLKAMITENDKPEALVQNYFETIKDASLDNFSKVLNLKGIPRSDHNRYSELFKSHLKAHTDLQQEWPVLAHLRVDDDRNHTRVPSSHLHVPTPSNSKLFENNNPLHNLEKGLGRITQEGYKFQRFFKRDSTSGNSSPVQR